MLSAEIALWPRLGEPQRSLPSGCHCHALQNTKLLLDRAFALWFWQWVLERQSSIPETWCRAIEVLQQQVAQGRCARSGKKKSLHLVDLLQNCKWNRWSCIEDLCPGLVLAYATLLYLKHTKSRCRCSAVLRGCFHSGEGQAEGFLQHSPDSPPLEVPRSHDVSPHGRSPWEEARNFKKWHTKPLHIQPHPRRNARSWQKAGWHGNGTNAQRWPATCRQAAHSEQVWQNHLRLGPECPTLGRDGRPGTPAATMCTWNRKVKAESDSLNIQNIPKLCSPYTY